MHIETFSRSPSDDASSVIIATMTWAKDATEEVVLRASLAALASHNLPVVVTDGGSSQRFVEYLRSFPHFEVLTVSRAGVVGQTRSSLRAAREYKRRFVLYTEPDKELFFTRTLGDVVAHANAIKDERHGVSIIARSDESFATYPATQRTTEAAINRLCARETALQTDFCYGPLLLRSELSTEMDAIEDELGWGWRFTLCVLAHRRGFHLASFTADLPCPHEQRGDDQGARLHRMRQLRQNLAGLMLALGREDLSVG